MIYWIDVLKKERNMLERMSEYFTSYGSSNAYIYMYCRDIAWVMFWSKAYRHALPYRLF